MTFSDVTQGGEEVLQGLIIFWGEGLLEFCTGQIHLIPGG
jgi:hypothetical protein